MLERVFVCVLERERERERMNASESDTEKGCISESFVYVWERE